MDILKIIDENRSVSSEISEIMNGTESKKIKTQRLRALWDNCEAPLAKTKADYYIEKIRKKQHEKLQRIILAVISLPYLIFTLCRVWWYCRPESNPFPKTNYTVVDLINVMYLLTIICAVLWGVKKAVYSIKNKIK